MGELDGLKVAVDVQHLYREGIHRHDRGSFYRLRAGGSTWETDCSLHYAQALTARLEEQGAHVLTNEVRTAILVGAYSSRQHAAMAWGANAYLACHLNSGGGDYALCEYAEAGDGAALGGSIVNELVALHGVKSAHVVGLNEGDRGLVCVRAFTSGPAVIVEPLFGDNPDHQWFLSLEGLAMVGELIARGVAGWWRTSRTPLPVT